MSKATKRRRVWVSFMFGSPREVQFEKFDKTETDDQGRFVERLPGDVVLSREEVEALRDMAWTLAGDHRREMLALLRGGR